MAHSTESTQCPRISIGEALSFGGALRSQKAGGVQRGGAFPDLFLSLPLATCTSYPPAFNVFSILNRSIEFRRKHNERWKFLQQMVVREGVQKPVVTSYSKERTLKNASSSSGGILRPHTLGNSENLRRAMDAAFSKTIHNTFFIQQCKWTASLVYGKARSSGSRKNYSIFYSSSPLNNIVNSWFNSGCHSFQENYIQYFRIK